MTITAVKIIVGVRSEDTGTPKIRNGFALYAINIIQKLTTIQMKTTILLLLLTHMSVVAQRTVVLAETFSFPGCDNEKAIKVAKYYDKQLALIDWIRIDEESENRCRRKLDCRGSDSAPGLYLEGDISINLNSIYSELPQHITDILNKPVLVEMDIRYHFSPGSVKVVVHSSGGYFWFVSKTYGSNAPFHVFHPIERIPEGKYEYNYPIDRRNNETEFIAWVQGIGITDNIVRLKFPKYRKN